MSSEKPHFEPVISKTPDLPAIDFKSVGAEAPVWIDSKTNFLTEADAVVMTWTAAEWAALNQVFCVGDTPMTYEERENSYWRGWHRYDADLPSYPEWDFWCYYTMVTIQGRKVMLIKSNTHLDFPGQQYLEEFISRVNEYVKPKVFLSIGTAGGTRLQDHEGTVNIVNSGTFHPKKVDDPADWPVYANSWKADWSTVEHKGFKDLLFPVPTTEDDLESIVEQYNKFYEEKFTLKELNPGNVNMADPAPKLNNYTNEKMSLITVASFIVATTDNKYDEYAVMEMDDAIIGKVCLESNTPFGFFRNISDPVQSKDISVENQTNWGGAIYKTYGLYTSFNGALAAWAVLNSQLK